jgi:hypothetical protein
MERSAAGVGRNPAVTDVAPVRGVARRTRCAPTSGAPVSVVKSAASTSSSGGAASPPATKHALTYRGAVFHAAILTWLR